MHAVQSSCNLKSENLLLIWPLKSIEMVLVLYRLIYRNTKLIFDTSLNKYNSTFISFFLFCSCKQTEEFLKNGGATKKIYMSDEVTHCLGKKYLK